MAFGTFSIHAGDFIIGKKHQLISVRKGLSSNTQDYLLLKTKGKFFREKIALSKIKTLEIANEGTVKSFSAGAAVAGAVLLGPLGLLAGAVGRDGKEVTFICHFQDGRKFLGTSQGTIFTKLQQAIAVNEFNNIH